MIEKTITTIMTSTFTSNNLLSILSKNYTIRFNFKDWYYCIYIYIYKERELNILKLFITIVAHINFIF